METLFYITGFVFFIMGAIYFMKHMSKPWSDTHKCECHEHKDRPVIKGPATTIVLGEKKKPNRKKKHEFNETGIS